MKEIPLIDMPGDPAVDVHLLPAVRKRFEACRYTARRFFFDAQASIKIGQFVRDCSGFIVDNYKFAQPPYPITYIEFDSQALFKEFRGFVTDKSDTRHGYLIVDNYVYVTAIDARNYKGRGIGLVTFSLPDLSRIGANPWEKSVYRVNNIPLNENTPNIFKAIYVMGGRREIHPNGDTQVSFPLDINDVKEFIDSIDIKVTFTGFKDKNLNEYAFLAGGDPLFCIGALLLLNQSSKHITLDAVKAERRMSHGKLRTFQAHTVVKIHLEPEVSIRRLVATNQSSPRIQHEVRAHWTHYHKTENCTHDWRQLSEKHFICTSCKTLRVRRKAHMRGSKEGFSTKHYEVHQ